MKKSNTLLTAMLFAFASAAFAADSSTDTASSQTTKPTTGQGAATTVSTTPASAKSDGHADKGLSTAKKNITAKHGKDSKDNGAAMKVEHAATPDHPAKPDRPAR